MRFRTPGPNPEASGPRSAAIPYGRRRVGVFRSGGWLGLPVVRVGVLGGWSGGRWLWARRLLRSGGILCLCSAYFAQLRIGSAAHITVGVIGIGPDKQRELFRGSARLVIPLG